jgi:acetamidase/formamidase
MINGQNDVLHSVKREGCFEANPLVGPFYVEEAQVGDTLVIDLLKIRPSQNFAYSEHKPGFGALGIEDFASGPTGLAKPIPQNEYRWNLDIERSVGKLELKGKKNRYVEIPVCPFLGCIGTAPRFGQVLSSIIPAEHGGNMDCMETKTGTRIFLPIFQKGAYLFIGDMHAAQGDGEICGSALETTGEITFRIDILRRQIRWPRFEDDEYMMVAASVRPLIDAVRISYTELINWISKDYDFNLWEAYQLVSQVGRIRIGNVVNPNYTVVAKIPKMLLN